ncbi:MAG: hypothetical protein HY033_08355 [Ignavibacteriae bacterium]|nr:hypothetical protein [Ignavibacteria bacterium]MBI3364905.1 hypothetical protein [Ignavibacteriota bacterium]
MANHNLEKFSYSNNVKPLLYYILLILLVTTGHAQNAGSAGAFARLGYGARGMAMGNAGTAINAGTVATCYNPALASFSEERIVAATFGILAFDRYLNFLSYTQAIQPTAGISIGLINAGVRNIDGRDEDGEHTDDYSTSENQFFLAFSNKVDQSVSLGVSVKLYYSKLFNDVKSTTVGFDLGAYVQATEALGIGLTVQDLNSKYKWDTKDVYGAQAGGPSEDKFPNLRRLGFSYKLPASAGILTAEFENSSLGTNVVRVGAEYNVIENFTVRGGADRIDLGDAATGVKPTFGFSVKNSFNGWSPALHYAFIAESYASHGMHIITLSTAF